LLSVLYFEINVLFYGVPAVVVVIVAIIIFAGDNTPFESLLFYMPFKYILSLLFLLILLVFLISAELFCLNCFSLVFGEAF